MKNSLLKNKRRCKSIIIFLVLTISTTIMYGISNVSATMTPDLGAAASFGVLADTYYNSQTTNTINGDLGYTTAPATAPTLSGLTHMADATYMAAGSGQAAALSGLNNEECTFNFATGAIDLATNTTFTPNGVYTPGVYCIEGVASIGTSGIILSGNGTYIFRMDGALNAEASSIVTLANGASAGDVFWTPNGATTLKANSKFIGTIIPEVPTPTQDITILSTASWTGRALAFGSYVRTPDSNIIITVPTGDTTPPDAPVFTTTGQTVSGITITLYGTAESGSTVYIYSGATIVATGGSNSTFGIFVSLNEGTNTFTAKAVDAAGNTGSASAPLTITRDTTPPIVNVGSDVITNTGITRIGTASDTGAGVATYVWSTISGTGTITFGSVNSGSTTISSDTEGAFVLQLLVTDNAGNTGADTMTFTRDTTAPVLSFSDNVEIGPVASDIVTPSRGEAVARRWMYSADTGCSLILGDYTYNEGSPMDQSNETYNGKYICMLGVDSYSNTATLASAHPINIDITPPTFAGVTSGAYYSGDRFITFDDINLSGATLNGASYISGATIHADGTYVFIVVDLAGNFTGATFFIDETDPVITLLGSGTVTVEVGSTYTDSGATASDNFYGDITSSIITGGTVNTSIVSGYTITYNVTDAHGNTGIQVIRTVNVVDTTKPVITLLGSGTVTIEVGGTYTDSGATALDTYDGDITASIVSGGTVNTSVVSGYTITYNVTDAHGNTGIQVIRTVNVVDTTKPVITLLGSGTVIIEAGSTYIDSGATALDNYDGNITATIISGSSVNTSLVGSYSVTYNVTDAHGNTGIQVTRTVNVVDTTKPVITLSGSDPVTVEVHSGYTDVGATALDSYDGDITLNIIINNPVDEDIVGSYTITYNVTDVHGNTGVQVTRTVNVVDTTKPVITLLGSGTVTIEVGGTYSDSGATALDNYDEDITTGIVIINSVNTGVVGAYSVTYNITDANGNAATQVTRTVNVVDTTDPVITLSGSTPITIEVGSTYIDSGATASDNFYGDITASIVTGGTVNTSVVSGYTLTYNVTDQNGHTATQVTRTVNVVDTTDPVITLSGSTPITIEVGSTYIDSGATASDNFYGDITSSIVTGGTVNTSVVSGYTLTYNVTDQNGHTATQVTRTVNVVDTTKPVITLLGSGTVTIEVGGTYTDSGATALDTYDGDITASIVSGGTVNTSVVSGYTITYNVTDAHGNTAVQVTRTVNVVDTTKPVITLSGSTPLTIEVGSTYLDSGATALDTYDGDITASIVSGGTVNTSVVSGYTITYDVTDANGNTAVQVTRTVNVVDTTPSPGGGHILQKDTCPNGDLSSSFYDGICTVVVTTGTTPTEKIGSIIGSSFSDELNDAYLYAYPLGITTMPTIQQANMDRPILRKELAKMISVFATKIVKLESNDSRVCEFGDIAQDTQEFQYYMKLSCKLGLMGMHADGVTPKAVFDPNEYVDRAQFGTVFSRLIFGDIYNLKNEDTLHNKQSDFRYKNHLTALNQSGIMNNITTPLMQELRGYVMLMMMRSTK